MAHTRIRPRRSTAAEWEYQNPILAEGEMGVEVPETGVGTGLTNVKFGDGVTTWSDLPYAIIGRREEEEKRADLKLNTSIRIPTTALRIS